MRQSSRSAVCRLWVGNRGGRGSDQGVLIRGSDRSVIRGSGQFWSADQFFHYYSKFHLVKLWNVPILKTITRTFFLLQSFNWTYIYAPSPCPITIIEKHIVKNCFIYIIYILQRTRNPVKIVFKFLIHFKINMARSRFYPQFLWQTNMVKVAPFFVC